MTDIKRPGSVLQSDEPEMETSDFQAPRGKKKSGLVKILGIIIVIAVVILIGLYLVSKYTKFNVLNISKSTTAQSSGWSAVFLTNGQVYFGKISKGSENWLTLSNIYYLQVTSQIQPAQGDQQQQQNVSLVKLGNELHGPKDEMKINQSQILFTEDLKSDSRVVDAITRYMQENK